MSAHAVDVFSNPQIEGHIYLAVEPECCLGQISKCVSKHSLPGEAAIKMLGPEKSGS